MPAKDVKAYVKRNKNDAADAEAICEAVRRPTIRFVQVKSAEQQAQLMQHRARDLLMRQRTQPLGGGQGCRPVDYQAFPAIELPTKSAANFWEFPNVS
jgi:transposase